VVVRPGPGGDLARLLALEDRFPEERVDVVLREPRRARPAPLQLPAGISNPEDFSAFECPGCRGPRVLMYQDSFNTDLAPFLSEHFSRVVYGGGSRNLPELIERERPALFVHEFVERVLMCADAYRC
jgi:alginate O-acetyltransferase complex protein AlgJ